MPVNEIEAEQYLKIKYSTPVATHNLTLYFANLSGVDTVTGELGQAAISGVIPYGEIVREVLQRARSLGGIAVTGVNQIELWKGNIVGANLFQGFVNPPTLTGTVIASVASSYRMWIYGNLTNRQKARVTLFEAVSASPQKFTEGQPPTTDDGTMSWYILKSGVDFSTQDGVVLTTYLSLNQGYNRKLARSYGRELQP